MPAERQGLRHRHQRAHRTCHDLSSTWPFGRLADGLGLPASIFPAVEIDGEAYWDGGFSGNPALYPLVDDQDCRDLVVVQVNPLVRQRLPDCARDVINRINEITFNSSLIKELRSIQLLQRLIEAEGLELENYRAMRLHLIHTEQDIESLGASSKMNAEWRFISRLHELGRRWADQWLDEHFDAIGQHSTFDLDAVFDDTFRPLGRTERLSGSPTTRVNASRSRSRRLQPQASGQPMQIARIHAQ